SPTAASFMLAISFLFYGPVAGQYGRTVSVPQLEDGTPLFVPTAAATMTVAVVLAIILIALAIYVMRVNVFLPRDVLRAGMVLLALIFLARGLSWHPYIGLFKRIRTTPFARNDTRFYSPGCIASGLGFLFLAWQG